MMCVSVVCNIYGVLYSANKNQVASCQMKAVDRGENRDMKKEGEEDEDTETAGI